MKTEVLSVDLLVIDRDTQSRISIHEETVEDYAELISESAGQWPFSPLDVFHDGNEYLVADGFHRTLAAQREKRGSIPCNVHKGTAKDARIFAMTANDRHGLRMTRADKRACVEWLLDNGGKMSQTEIASKAGVSRRLVSFVVSERNSKSAQIAQSETRKPPVVASVVSSEESIPWDDVDEDSSEPEGSGLQTVYETPEPDVDEPETPPAGKCPSCAGTKWVSDEFGWICKKCTQPYGEPAGDVDNDRLGIQRSKTVKTAEALMRAFDDLQTILCRPGDHSEAISACKAMLQIARDWK